MKVTADKKYLKKVVDKADYAMIRAIEAKEKGEDPEPAKLDWLVANHYFVYLGVKALEDKELAKNLQGTLKELVKEGTTLEPQLIFLAQFVEMERRIRYDPPGEPGVEELERDFERFNERISIEEAREYKEDVREYARLSKKGKKKVANQMFA